MRKAYFFLFVGMALLSAGCGNNTYSDLRKQEDKLIANYISRNHLSILDEEPAEDYVWKENEYYKVSGVDNLYFHLIKRGDKNNPVQTNDAVTARYKRFALTENADTLSYWSTLDKAYPEEFHYGNTSECECVAWHYAIRLMKYSDAQCEVIVPSKLGFSAEQSSVTPYVYILKFKVKQ